MSRREQRLIRLAALARRRPARGIAAWLAVFALLLQLCLPLVHHPAAGPSAVSAGLLWLGGGVCLGAGHPASPDGGPASAPGKSTLCPICLALALGGTYLLPALTALCLALALSLPIGGSPTTPRRSARLGLAALPRAPPQTA